MEGVLIDVAHKTVDNSACIAEVILGNDSEEPGELIDGRSLDQRGLGEVDAALDSFFEFWRLLRIYFDDMDQDINRQLGKIEVIVFDENADVLDDFVLEVLGEILIEDTHQHAQDFESRNLNGSVLLEEKDEDLIKELADEGVEFLGLRELEVFGGDLAQSFHGLLSLDFGLQLAQQVGENLDELFSTHGVGEDGKESGYVDCDSRFNLAC